ncbi:MAG: PEP-CTERM sorting domain-containing protein [Verrucomicrobiota bacterium]
MKLSKTLTGAFLALAGVTLLAPSAKATLSSYTTGDILLGFRQTGASTSYVINLGQTLSQDIASGTSFTFQLSQTDLNTVLGSTFGGSTWSSASSFWSLGTTTSTTGALGLNPTELIVSKNETTVGVQSTPWTIGANNVAGNTALKNLGTSSPGGFKNTTLAAASGMSSDLGLQAVIENASSTYAWNKFSPVGTSGGSFSQFTGGTGVEGSFAGGAAGTVLDLYLLDTPANGVVSQGQSSQFLGTLSIDNNANVTFAAVPEPSTYVLMGAGILAVAAFSRRRQQA